MPKVSFIVPCFDQWEYLPYALDSIDLQDGSADKEIIVVCETGPNFPKRDRMSGVDKIIWHEKNIGLAAARTSALRLSEADYVVPLDADDTIEPTFLERTLKCARPFVAVNASGRLNGHILEHNYLPYCGLFNRELLLKMGGWRRISETQGMEDWDLWIRLYLAGANVACLPDKLFNWRRHPDSMSAAFEGKPLFDEMKADLMRKNGL